MILPRSLILYGMSEKNNIDCAYAIAIKGLLINSSISPVLLEKHVRNNSYPNFMFIGKNPDDKEIPIEKIRDMIEFLSKCSDFDGMKIVVIEAADTLNRYASNAILKILEDLHDDSSIILTTSSLFSLLPTIRSRCQKIFVPSDSCSPLLFEDVTNYIIFCTKFEEFFVKSVVSFLNSGSGNISDFYKNKIQDNTNEFVQIALFYGAYNSLKSMSYNACEKYLKLQEFASSLKNTHLDNQAIVFSCCAILWG